ncbi:type II secretion system protein M [Thalassotalea ponticola]|uniref:type II secretion system protein M n=1 Tax=Thalassotalea ponticola TaxID=1523392 RepID=UPI0025B5A74B|nr:type II secretion system protein M [Thalassotalea ponticola]MDN3653004.1 type II secretion system protein M [Thalassotalea ponticola]
MKQWWLSLNQKEQRLVSILAVVVLIAAFYGLIWQPLNDKLDKAQMRLTKQQELALWVSENIPKLKAQTSTQGVRTNGASLSSIVSRTARRSSIAIARMQPQGDDLQVWIDEVEFNGLLIWLNALSSQESVRVDSIDLSEGSRPGTVSVRRLQLVKAG